MTFLSKVGRRVVYRSTLRSRPGSLTFWSGLTCDMSWPAAEATTSLIFSKASCAALCLAFFFEGPLPVATISPTTTRYTKIGSWTAPIREGGRQVLRSADDSGGAVVVVGGRGRGVNDSFVFRRRPLLPWLGLDLPAAALPLPSPSLQLSAASPAALRCYFVFLILPYYSFEFLLVYGADDAQ